jgi:hypothetical protein
VLVEESQALAEVAGVGLKRLWREPPLGAQMRQPARHLQREVLVGAVELDRLWCRNWLGHEPYALEAVIPSIISHLFRLPFANLAARR